jgi:hypothetical protein
MDINPDTIHQKKKILTYLKKYIFIKIVNLGVKKN